MKEPTSQELADWFVSSGSWRKIQGADGFNYSREDGGYVYIWIMAHVDLDLEQHYLIDVRISQPTDRWEDRHFLYVYVDAWNGGVTRHKLIGDKIAFNAAAEEHKLRLNSGLHRFADIVSDYGEISK